MSNVVFILEDNPDELILIKRAIRKAAPDIVVESASSGESALDLLSRVERSPDLFLVDLNLPGMSGVQFIKELRAIRMSRYVPVVVVTSSELESDMTSAYDAGANSYFRKSFAISDFSKDIKDIVSYWMQVNRRPQQV